MMFAINTTYNNNIINVKFFYVINTCYIYNKGVYANQQSKATTKNFPGEMFQLTFFLPAKFFQSGFCFL